MQIVSISQWYSDINEEREFFLKVIDNEKEQEYIYDKKKWSSSNDISGEDSSELFWLENRLDSLKIRNFFNEHISEIHDIERKIREIKEKKRPPLHGDSSKLESCVNKIINKYGQKGYKVSPAEIYKFLIGKIDPLILKK